MEVDTRGECETARPDYLATLSNLGEDEILIVDRFYKEIQSSILEAGTNHRHITPVQMELWTPQFIDLQLVFERGMLPKCSRGAGCYGALVGRRPLVMYLTHEQNEQFETSGIIPYTADRQICFLCLLLHLLTIHNHLDQCKKPTKPYQPFYMEVDKIGGLRQNCALMPTSTNGLLAAIPALDRKKLKLSQRFIGGKAVDFIDMSEYWHYGRKPDFRDGGSQ